MPLSARGVALACNLDAAASTLFADEAGDHASWLASDCRAREPGRRERSAAGDFESSRRCGCGFHSDGAAGALPAQTGDCYRWRGAGGAAFTISESQLVSASV